MRVCRDCGRSKPLSEYHANSFRKDGLCLYCKNCKNLRDKNRRTLQRVKEGRLSLNPGFKICYHCKEEKPHSDFDKAGHLKDGIFSYCKLCRIPVNRRFKEAGKEKYRISEKEWSRKNAGHRNSLTAKRRAAKLLRTPAWLTPEDWAAIKSWYDRAKLLTKVTGIVHHVDHIFPLQGKFVSGLHVPTNLQILTRSENSQKSNSWKP